ncbi:MAG: fasciclin domain-containing protein [Candidatus Omnitrophica bacterium]|nr:fasciclin domain-containing protein [Candidatus Omnitrophota bacterium]
MKNLLGMLNKVKFFAAAAVMASILIASSSITTKAAKPGDMTIAEIAASDPNFSILVSALQQTGLDEVLNGKGQYTVFAPLNSAFEGVDLSGLSEEELKNILLYHVAHGRRYSQSIVNAEQIRMLNGDFTEVNLADDGLYIDSALVKTPDISASNGVIHVIGGLLIP